mmetsp:Transcript_16394/g.44601  ORF Transcript_16394/g.44601 Transcript_16394/m.44601 type:complete len:288 (+) Transcript_16394:418-1281(+)
MRPPHNASSCHVARGPMPMPACRRTAPAALSDFIGQDLAPNVRHQLVHEDQVMLRRECHEERLVLLEEVVEVGARVRDGLARGVDRPKVVDILELLDLDRPTRAEQQAVARDPRRVARIHRVDAVRHDGLARLRVGDAEQVVGLVLRHDRHQEGEKLEHLRAVLAERPADGKAVKRQRREVLGRLAPHRLVGTAVHDAVHGLLARLLEVRAERARHPAVREADGRVQPLGRDVVRRQLVERDDDVGAKLLLRSDGRFGGELDGATVVVRAEDGAALRDAQQRAPGAH